MLTMPTPEHNIAVVKQRIANACSHYDRSNNSVILLAVSKTRDINTIRAYYDAGLRCFGENYLSEALAKMPQLPADIEWHFIGPIQSNKTRAIASHFAWVHSIERSKIARRLSEQRPPQMAPLNCLIQVNISDDPNKSGIAPQQLEPLARELLTLPGLRLRGLMAIPKAGQNEQQLENDFASMAQLLRQLQAFCTDADTLSLGMSADLELAIKHGSTLVRIGTDLFGARPT